MRNLVLNPSRCSNSGFARRIVELGMVCLMLAGCGGTISISRDTSMGTTKAPHIAWAAQTAIPYGTALSAAQLNATADVPGAFTYTPALGAVLSAGSHTLSVAFTPTDATAYASATASVTLTVNQAAPVLNWAPPAAISYGTELSTVPLNATASVPGVFTYTPSLGTVFPAGSHTLSVTFTPTDTTDYSIATASATLKVTESAPVLSWTTPAAISYGTALSAAQLNATANVPGVFTYTPSLGTVFPAGSHTLSVTFTPTDTTDYSIATASATLKVTESAPVLSWTTPAAISYGTALSAAQLNATASVPGVFTYTPSVGTVLAAGSHTLSVTFTPTDVADYSVATVNVTLKVNESAPVLSWTTPAAISYGTALSAAQLNATASVPGVFTYTPSLGTVLAAGSHTLSVTFTPTDATDYSVATVNVTLKVNDSAPVLSWTTPAAISYGTALSAAQLNATASVPGVLTYSPSLGTVLASGSQTLSVTFTPTDTADYAIATASVTLAVSQATPLISWAPATTPISVGMALGPNQLNATATAPGGMAKLAGSFLYTPASGTILTTSGAQTLSVTFTPTDTEDYTTAEASVTLTVTAFGVVAWGDSLTFGRDGLIDEGAYPSELQPLITIPVQNMGVSAQTSTQIGVREGGVPVHVTVAGGTIPASGSVVVTFPTNYEPINTWGPAAGVTGTILGVHGTVTLASGVFTFTPTTPGSAVSAPGTPQFVVDTPYASYIPVFWEGENNFFAKAQILSDIAAQVATVPSERTYLVLSITNRDVTSDWIGGSDYNEIVAINNQLANTYGSHYLDVRQLLISHYDPALATDVSDYNHDVVPTSLRAVSGAGTLGSSIGQSDSSFTVNLTTGTFSVNSILTIDTGENAENVKITAVSGSTVTVTRNYGGLNAAHAAGAPVTEADYVHLNAHGYQIIANAVAQYLSAYDSPKQ
jgi:lysophospholipase L1-like esterase/uncharacterized membrane protein